MMDIFASPGVLLGASDVPELVEHDPYVAETASELESEIVLLDAHLGRATLEEAVP